MAKLRQVKFNADWLNDRRFEGIKAHKTSEFQAYCTVCKKSFSLSNMGKIALASHAEGAKHSKAAKKTTDIRLFCQSSGAGTSGSCALSSGEVTGHNEDASMTPDKITMTGESESLREDHSLSTSQLLQPGVISTRATNTASTDSRISKYLIQDDVTRAEILWTLQAVENHVSFSTTGKQTALFPVMFPNDNIASRMQLGRTKTSYGIVHGLAPHFKKNILKDLEGDVPLVVLFDESLNKVAELQQMDIALRYWHKIKKQVDMHYFSSAFLGHTTVADMLEAFKAETTDLNLSNMVQVSMDGPNVNWAFLRDLRLDLKTVHGDSAPTFIDMGSCGLHTVHQSFKNAALKTNWGVVPFLRSIYNVFKNVPARRADYTRFNKPDNPPFPKKFCSVRWLENEEVADQAVKIIPFLKTYVAKVKEHKIKIDTYSWRMMLKYLEDPLLPAKLSFFSFVSGQVTPFLREFQCVAPMAPFLYNALSSLLTDVMSLVVKSEVLSAAKSVCDIKFDSEAGLIPAIEMNLGHAVRSVIRKVKVPPKDILKFRTECRNFLIAMCSNLLIKSPLKYGICRYISFCDPSVINSSPRTSKARILNALQKFSSQNWISAKDCDNVEKEFVQLLSKEEFLDLCGKYRRTETRLDHFWRDTLDGDPTRQYLYVFLQKVLILSHGQAFVEQGFSVNKECIIHNQETKSLVAIRQVYDGLKSAGGVLKIDINKRMILDYRSARDRYSEALKQKRREDEEEAERARRKRSIVQQIKELEAKKSRIIAERATALSGIDEEIASITKQF